MFLFMIISTPRGGGGRGGGGGGNDGSSDEGDAENEGRKKQLEGGYLKYVYVCVCVCMCVCVCVCMRVYVHLFRCISFIRYKLEPPSSIYSSSASAVLYTVPCDV